MGVTGGVLVFGGIVLFISQSVSPWAIIAYILANIASVVLLIRFALWRIKAAKPQYSIYSYHDQMGYVASKFDKAAIGKQGIVLSDLKPGGYILIEGKQHQALSQEGYIVKGSAVIIIGGQEESLIVKKVKKEESS